MLAAHEARDDVLVLALPRGGVPVASIIAEQLSLPLDVLLVRKLGVPGQEELAMGAIAAIGGRWAIVLNEQIVSSLGLSDEVIQEAARREGDEIARRESLYGSDRVAVDDVDITQRELIVVDDGLATGATMRAAVSALRRMQPRRIVVAVPVAPADTVRDLEAEVDEVVCAATPGHFGGVGQWYDDFSQVSDEQVRTILAAHHGQSSRSSFGRS